MDLHTVLVTLHLIGFAFGLGGATASDLVFIRSTRDGSVSADEFKIIKTLSKLVWAAVALTLLSGATIMWLQYLDIGEVPRLGWSFFQVKMLAFAMLVINGLVFHFKVFPLLGNTVGYSFRDPGIKAKYWLFGLTGAVSIVSWYTVFLMVALRRVWEDYSFVELALGYLTIIPLAAIGAYFTLNLHANEGNFKQTVKDMYPSRFVRYSLLGAIGLFALFITAVIRTSL